MNQKTLIVLAVAALSVLAGYELRKLGWLAEPAAAKASGPEAAPAETDEKKVSDLDRPVADLIALTCEHHKKTFECDECRYEAGFVRAPASLVQGGLIAVAPVESRPVSVPIALTGEVRFDERRVGQMSSQVEGLVKEVLVALGDPVKKGQALVAVESVEVVEAQAASLEARSLAKLARRSFERAAELRRENIFSEKEYLAARQESEAAQIRAESARGKLTRLGADPAEAGPGRLVIRAPMDGAVLALRAVPGQAVKTDEPLVTVGDNRTVWVWADLYERDLAAVKRAQAAGKLAAKVTVRAYPGQTFPGAVHLLSTAMDESSRTAKIMVEVDNPDGRLLPGMFAAVKVLLPGDDEALAVPCDAVLEDEGRAFVFILHHDDYYVRRPVAIGRAWPGWVEIKQGLEPGQTVVAEGAFLLKSDVLRSKMGAGCAD